MTSGSRDEPPGIRRLYDGSRRAAGRGDATDMPTRYGGPA